MTSDLTSDSAAITRSREDSITAHFRRSRETLERAVQDGELMQAMIRCTGTMAAALRGGHKILIAGNGGSAADAQHIAAEFVGRFAFDRPALPALSLSVNTSCLTAIGNDYGFDQVFARQIEAVGHSGDIAIGISTSGNSPNVLCAVSAARKIGLHTIGFTGRNGGDLRRNVEHCISVPSNETPRIQECHILIGHVIAEMVEQAIFHEQQSCVSGS